MLDSLRLFQFKNHTSYSLSFEGPIHLIIGPNGSGKSNILDAIHYLAFFRSMVNSVDSQLIEFEYDFFRIESQWSDGYEVIAKYAEKRKSIEINGIKVKKYSESFGHIPLVLASPADIYMLHGGSEDRRKFIDTTIAQYDRSYLQHLTEYQEALNQRNALLKQGEPVDNDLISFYNHRLSEHAQPIHAARQILLTQFLPRVNHWYSQIASDDRMAIEPQISLEYQSKLNQSLMLDLLKEHFKRDMILERTTVGIHKDDMNMMVEGIDVKKIASQGQQKSLLYALRLAQAEVIFLEKGKKPIFLLDDFSDKLDIDRSQNLLKIIQEISFVEQWILTDTKLPADQIAETMQIIYL